MLKVILNRLKLQGEEIIAEEQAWFRVGRSTRDLSLNPKSRVKSNFNISRISTMSFIDFKKAFDRVWLAALGATMRKSNNNTNPVRAIEQLYDNAVRTVQMNGSTGEWIRTTAGARHGCLFLPTLFNIFLGTLRPML